MAHVFTRIWDVIVGLMMLVLAVVVQWILLGFLAAAVFGIAGRGHIRLSDWLFSAIMIGMFVVFNGIASWVYFRRLRRAGLDEGDEKIEGLGGPPSTSATCIIFLLPRAFARILIGGDRLSGSAATNTPESPGETHDVS